MRKMTSITFDADERAAKQIAELQQANPLYSNRSLLMRQAIDALAKRELLQKTKEGK